MRDRHDLHHYQHAGVEFALDVPRCMLWLDLGLGKTIITLTTIADLLDRMDVGRVLVVAPLRVAKNNWPSEVREWHHIRHVRMSVVHGTPQQRLAALKRRADVYCINYENLYWLAKVKGIRRYFDMAVFDESRNLSNKSAKRSRAARFFAGNVERVIELTATPAPNSMTDLFHQTYLIDQGKRFGETLKAFRFRYFDANVDRDGDIRYEVKPWAEKAIHQQLRDITMTLRKEDYLDMPERVDVRADVELTEDEMAHYEAMETEYALSVSDDKTIEAISAGALLTKLAQLANGAIYDAEKQTHFIHDQKLDALRELVAEAGDEPVLVAYNFRSDMARILKAFPKARVLDKSQLMIDEWNAGKIPMLLVHPKSAGHGLNLQYGGRIVVWFSPSWSLELDQQLNARLHRQGQSKPVRVYRIVAKGTVDESIMRALSSKTKMQDSLLDAMKHVIENVKSRSGV